LFAVTLIYKIGKQFGLISGLHEANLRSKKKLPLNLLLLDLKRSGRLGLAQKVPPRVEISFSADFYA
jgi:hypothetical protein